MALISALGARSPSTGSQSVLDGFGGAAGWPAGTGNTADIMGTERVDVAADDNYDPQFPDTYGLTY